MTRSGSKIVTGTSPLSRRNRARVPCRSAARCLPSVDRQCSARARYAAVCRCTGTARLGKDVEDFRGDDETGGVDRDAPLQRRRADGKNTAASDADVSDSVKTGTGIDDSTASEDQIVRGGSLPESDGAADECDGNEQQRQAFHAMAALSSVVGRRPARRRWIAVLSTQARSHTVFNVNGRSCESNPRVLAIIVAPSPATT